MVSAVGSPSFSGAAVAGNSPVGLEARLQQYRTALADWVSCPSCKTAEGKAKIAEINGKIAELEQRIEAANSSKPGQTAVLPGQNSLSSAGAANNSFDDSAAARPIGSLGSRLDVYA